MGTLTTATELYLYCFVTSRTSAFPHRDEGRLYSLYSDVLLGGVCIYYTVTWDVSILCTVALHQGRSVSIIQWRPGWGVCICCTDEGRLYSLYRDVSSGRLRDVVECHFRRTDSRPYFTGRKLFQNSARVVTINKAWKVSTRNAKVCRVTINPQL